MSNFQLPMSIEMQVIRHWTLGVGTFFFANQEHYWGLYCLSNTLCINRKLTVVAESPVSGTLRRGKQKIIYPSNTQKLADLYEGMSMGSTYMSSGFLGPTWNFILRARCLLAPETKLMVDFTMPPTASCALFCRFNLQFWSERSQPANTMDVKKGERVVALLTGIVVAVFIMVKILQDGFYAQNSARTTCYSNSNSKIQIINPWKQTIMEEDSFLNSHHHCG